MNHCVPVFDMEDEDSNPTSSRLSLKKKSKLCEEEVAELLWQNGQVVVQSQSQSQSQNQRSVEKSPDEDAVIPAGGPTAEGIRPSAAAEEETANQLFMQEAEMASWLHYPLDDSFERDFCADLLYTSPSGNFTPSVQVSQISEDLRPGNRTLPAPQPPTPPARHMEPDSPAKFRHFSRPKVVRSESRPSVSEKAARESMVVDSSETPAVGPGSGVSYRNTAPISGCSTSVDGATANMAKESVTCEPAATSSSSGSGANAEPSLMPAAEDRKRKAREADDNECLSEFVESESMDARKEVPGSTSSRRSRAAEVHNLSERRRRDRINEKMKALQELIPRCNKSDKASMLDEAIDYLKSLQLQVQMMSMRCNMVPMMFPGVQQYMTPMGMGMDLVFNRPMLSFPSILAGPAIPTPAEATHLGPRLPTPAFHPPPVSTPDQSRMQTTNQSNPLNSIGIQSPNQLQVPNYVTSYQQYLGLHQMQVPPLQSQATTQPSTTKGVDTFENNHSG